MGFKNSNVVFVFLCALSEVLSAQQECCDWCVFVSKPRNTPSPELTRLFPPSLSISFLHLLPHFPTPDFSLPFFQLPLFMSACFLLLFSFICLSLLPPGALCIPARRGGGVCDPDKDQTSPPRCPPLVFTLGLTPSLGKWAQPRLSQGTDSLLKCAAASLYGSKVLV